MQTIKMISFYTASFYAALIWSTLQHSPAYAAEQKAIEVATVSTQTVLGTTMEGLATAGPYIKIAVKAYDVGQEIRKHTFPTIKEKAHAEAVAEQFALLTAENELQRCLIDNRRSRTINRFGRPTACEDIAEMLRMLGGRDELNKMTAIYSQYSM
jgi:hypothetical protein